MDFQWIELFQSVLIVSGIATVLAVLMVIADATIGNYGEKKLTINNDEEKIVEFDTIQGEKYQLNGELIQL